MKLLTDRAASGLRGALDVSGYSSWYQRHSGIDYDKDPWSAFQRVSTQAKQENTNQSSLVALFVLNIPVPETSANIDLGWGVVEDLLESGLLIRTTQGIESNYCILSSFGRYLLVEYPAETYGGMLISSKTYLSALSFRLIRATRTYVSVNSVLELGCGTGLFSIMASQLANNVMATDIDPSALVLADANMRLNGCSIILQQTDMFRGLPERAFDLTVFNPPWRLVPSEIAYPNVPARVGSGIDGLDTLRAFLGHLPNHMADSGRSIFFAELPGTEGGCEFSIELSEFATRSGCSINITSDEPIPVTTQARLSAETAWYLNKNFSVGELTERFLRNYERLGYSLLHPVRCLIKNDGEGRITYHD